MYGKSEKVTGRCLAQPNKKKKLLNTIFCLNFAIHRVLRRKLYAIRFPYKHSKFGTMGLSLKVPRMQCVVPCIAD